MSTERRSPSPEQAALCAHDLRGALTVIVGYTSLLRRDDLSAAERATALDGIDAAVARADALLADTLSGRLTTHPADSEADLAALAQQAAADARASFGRTISVATHGSPRVAGDGIGLARVLENLLSNAAKYAPEGTIDVVARKEGDRAVIEVADRGPGIPAGSRQAILEPFARLPRDEALPGTGLGLAVVSGVAERLGGHVEIRERDGGGTVVYVEVPALP